MGFKGDLGWSILLMYTACAFELELKPFFRSDLQRDKN